MSSFIDKLLHGIKPLIVRSLRTILFLGCLISIIAQIGYLYMVATIKSRVNSIELPGGLVGPDGIAFAFGSIILSLLSCYATFYKDYRPLRAVSCHCFTHSNYIEQHLT